MAFKTSFFIHFDEADPAGILFFGNVFTLTHRAIEEYVDSKIGWKTWYATHGYGAPLRNVAADFQNPILPGKSYDVEVTVFQIGSSSVQFQTRFLNGDKVCAVVNTSHVFVSKTESGIKKIDIPDNIRQFLEMELSS